MLKTLGSTESKTRPGEGGVGVGGSSARCGKNKLDGSDLDGVEFDGSEISGGEVEGDEIGKKGRKTSKSKNLSKSKKTVGSDFLTSGARLAFTKLRQAFVKAPILYHFNPKCHIRIETDESVYAIGGVLSQLTSDDSGR